MKTQEKKTDRSISKKLFISNGLFLLALLGIALRILQAKSILPLFLPAWLFWLLEIVLVIVATGFRWAAEKVAEDQIFFPEMQRLFDAVQLDQTAGFGKEDIEGADLFDIEDVNSSFLLQGMYQGMPFQFGEVRIHAAIGFLLPIPVTAFKGYYLKLYLPEKLPCTVKIFERPWKNTPGICKLVRSNTPGDVLTGKESFDKDFQVVTGDPAPAAGILSDEFISSLLKADELARANTYFALTGKEFYIAVEGGRGFLTLGWFKALKPGYIRKKYLSNIQFLINMIKTGESFSTKY